MFNRPGIKRLAAVAAALALAGALTTTTAEAADAPAPVAAKPEAKAAAKPAKVEKSYAERRAADGPWAQGADWIQFGAGYARAGGKNAGDGLGGYGVAYQHMLSNKWSFGASIRHEVSATSDPATRSRCPSRPSSSGTSSGRP